MELEVMNTMTDFKKPTLEDSNALVSALDWRMADDPHASSDAENGNAYSPNMRTMSSGKASSAWFDEWQFRGIPELDSPFAG